MGRPKLISTHHTSEARADARLGAVGLPDGVVFKVLEYMHGTAGARVPEITPPTHVTTPSEEPDEVLRKAIRALSETLRISDREAVELLLSSQQA